MDIKSAKLLIEAATELGIEAELYEDYIGRGMYGKTTTGVTTEDPIKLLGAALAIAYEIGLDGMHEENPFLSISEGLKTDSMGHGSIIY